jgi:type II secretory pathway component GspD/PulD (secretin)
VEELIATISRKGIDVATVVRELDHAQASPVYSAVTSFLSTRSTFSGQPTQVGLYPEYTTNRLLIFGPTEEIKVVTDLIDQLDSDLLTDLEIRVFPIKNAQAAYLTSPVGNFLSVKHSGSVAPYVTYEPNSNSLIVQAAPEDFQRVAQFLEQIDVPGIGSASQEMKVLPLKNALAPQVASALNSLLSYNYTGSVRPIVTYEANSNSLIIQAHPKDFARITELLKTLDVPQMSAQEVRVYPLEYANAAQVSSVLTNILYYNYTGSTRPFVTYEANSNSVIIQAHADDFPRVEEVIKKLDTKEVNDREMRVYQLTHVRASQIQAAVYNMLYYTYSGNVRPYVAYEDTSNTLIVQGTQDDFLKVEKILQQLDVPGTAGLESKIIPLQWANAQSIASALRPFQSPRGTVQSDDNTNSLILLDTPEAIARMSKFIEELDTEGLSTGVVTEVRTLKYVDGDYLARNILNEIAAQYAERRGRKGRPETRAYAEPNSNTIIVVGATEEVRTYLDLIDRFDKADFAGGETRFFQLKFTESSQLANQLSRLFRATQRGRSNVQTEVVADPYTNSIIAIGTEKDMRTIGELIQKLDIPEAGGLELEIFQLEGVNAQTLAQGLRGLQGPSRGSVMFSDPNSNTLVVKDTPEVIEQVRRVVEEMRQTGGEVASFVKNLEYADASRLVVPLQQFTQLRATQEGLTRPRVNVSAEPTTNSLLIFGPTNEIQAVTDLIEELDTEEFSKVEPRIFPLQHVLASQLVSPITQLLRQTTVGLNPPVVVAEQATNSLIVQAAEDDINRVQNLIDQLDQPQTGGLTTEVILLKNSSAQELSRAIRPPTLSERGTIFAESGTNSLVVTDTQAAIQRVREIVQAVDSADREIVYEVIQLKNTTVGTLEPSLQRFLTHLGRLKGVTQPLTELITDPVANSVVIYGPSDEAEVVMGLLDELDSEALFDREPGIFTLQNARATEVVPILTELLERDRRGRDPNSARVVADEKTNSVIVLATKGDMTRAADLISTLDRPDRGGLVTRIFRLKNTSPEVLGQTLRSYVDDPTKLFGDEASNSIVYTDTPGNLDRLGQLITELDQISGEEKPVSLVRALKNADASQAAQILNEFATQLATRKGRRRPLASAIADLSSNSVTLLGPQEEVDQMIVLLQDSGGSVSAKRQRPRHGQRTPDVDVADRPGPQCSANCGQPRVERPSYPGHPGRPGRHR